MRLSEAIRLGAMLKPQGFGPESVRAADATCAMGAAGDAAGLKACASATERLYALRRAFPLMDHEVEYPARYVRCRLNVMDVIWRLNDCDRWTREQIADWVETIEAQIEQPATPELEQTPITA